MAVPPRRARSRPGIMWCLVATFLTLIVLVGLAVLIFWLVVRPKPLEFTVDDAHVGGFNITYHKLNATFGLSLRAYNRNRLVSVYYDATEVTVWYYEQMLAAAEVPPFHQPRRNVTTLEVFAEARTAPLLGSVERSLKRDQSGGGVGLEVRVWARIRLNVGAVKTKPYTLRAYCSPVLVHFSVAPGFEKVYCDVVCISFGLYSERCV